MTDVMEYGTDFPLFLDHSRPYIISAFGKKGKGKSAFNREIYTSYPGDKLAIDVNGHAEPGEDAEKIDAPARHWPRPEGLSTGERRRPRNLHYIADPGSPTYRDDLDSAVGMCLFPKDHPVLMWAGEAGEMMPRGVAGPQLSRLLQQNRHYKVSALFDSPRPVWLDPQVLLQSNLVAVFELPNPADRKRIAEIVGLDPTEFSRICFETWDRGDYWFVLINTDARRGEQIWRCAPLPISDTAAQPAA